MSRPADQNRQHTPSRRVPPPVVPEHYQHHEVPSRWVVAVVVALLMAVSLLAGALA